MTGRLLHRVAFVFLGDPGTFPALNRRPIRARKSIELWKPFFAVGYLDRHRAEIVRRARRAKRKGARRGLRPARGLGSLAARHFHMNTSLLFPSGIVSRFSIRAAALACALGSTTLFAAEPAFQLKDNDV